MCVSVCVCVCLYVRACVSAPDLKLDLLVIELDGADLKIDADCGDERRVEGVVREPEEDACLANTAISDEQELEEVVVRLAAHGDGSVRRKGPEGAGCKGSGRW